MSQELKSENLDLTSIPGDTFSDLDRAAAGYDYELPPALIAQNPAVPRDSSRLLVVNSTTTGEVSPPLNHVFRDLPELLRRGDLLIMNNTKVIPARLYGRKSTGADVEVLLLEERLHNCWLALVKPGKRFKVGSQIVFAEVARGTWGCEAREETSPLSSSLTATVMAVDETTGGRILKFDVPNGKSLVQVLEKFGELPLPPYITDSQASNEQYQTVYAQTPGAVAAPTAGLHFTPELLEKLQNQGINQAFITLHVGVGTFRPVEVEDVTTHTMHEEWIEVPPETIEQIQATQAAGGRIIAVGTTAVRALEGAATASGGKLQPFCGKTNLFIYPGYKWQVVEGLITNFHLPRSSLLMLVSALIGRERLLKIYEEAIASQYRFYSFGDAMLILPEAVSHN
ncbi:tRNA preQ1(34) S-adenosylmethionine ribosyltransferase-isomerase QueA [Calothrix sp. UHCC 0171]|uniref:tRNA preQ1(34) S-adenosylmethionine ribosyltransferase-isomerase QueA n=1 Tax=Calothrix sp. UHCC 0171 TaxID=3110245 RepID=UPI002B1FB027|nr:tRNA preQ1(34) S-adenosylmethionine ribosyltransferase-isomerase QueA [Calothrix sp. UHCC 0171]MEA5571410.1 tRNA preQ1(34) S-adenosylmethionine ribosyltransferase-isomerase QueA [Calothrix sp. UHCC 0171]